MSRLQLIILWALTLVAGAIVFSLKSKDEQDTEAKTTLEQGAVVFEELDTKSVGGLKMADGENSATMRIADGRWVVTDKDNFLADTQKLANSFDKITKLKIVQGVPAEEQYYDRFGVDLNAEDEDDRPREVSVLSKSGEVIRTIYVGKPRENTGGLSSGNAGRFIRFSDDQSGIYVVNEDFYFFDEHPDSWLRKDFIKIERPLKISLTAEGEKATEPWTVSRKTQSANFELEGLPDTRQTAVVGTSPLKTIFSGGNFTELFTEEEAKKKRDDKEFRKVTIETSEKTVYEFTLWPEKTEEKEEEEDKGDGKKKEDTRNYIVTFTVKKGPQPPTDPGEGASEEEKAEFQAAMINYKGAPARVEKNKLLEKRFYLLPNTLVKALLVNRNEMHQIKPKSAPKPTLPTPQKNDGEKPAKATAVTPPIAVPPIPGSKPQPLPKKKKRIEAVTPPIAIPPLPKATEPKKADPPKTPDPIQEAEELKLIPESKEEKDETPGSDI